MKKFLLLLLLFSFKISSSQNVSLETLRKDYYKLNTDSSACAKLYEKLNKTNTSDKLILGYKGAISTSMANHVKNKQEKIKLFNNGKSLLEKSITADSSDVELRFLRFTIQSNCPKALGYYRQVNSDKKYIIDHLGSVKNSSLKNKITDYLLNTVMLSQEEKQKINAGTKK